MDSLTNGDLLKFDEVLDKNVIWFLNMIAYLKDKAKEKQKNEEKR